MSSPKATVIAIGTELLKGSVVNTNAAFVSKALSGLGIRVHSHMVCHDQFQDIESCLAQALSSSEVVILTGGLGPTPDDVTRDALADFFRVPLELSKPQVISIKKYYRLSKKSFPKMVEKEAMYPSNATPLVNRHGIALGFYIPFGERIVVVLPGVPLELEKMINEQVIPLLKQFFSKMRAVPSLTAKIVGLSEPDVMIKLRKTFFDEDFEFGIYPEPGIITIRVYAKSAAIIKRVRQKIKKTVGPHVYAFQEISLSEHVGAQLKKLKKTVSVAESCTGGLLASQFTEVPGASRYFLGGITAYSNHSKQVLGVSKEVIKTHGAVSQQVAALLSKGIRSIMKSTYGVGITGVAGPSGGTKTKPVGTVFISVAGPRRTQTKKFLFWGSRKQVQIKASIKALELLRNELHGR